MTDPTRQAGEETEMTHTTDKPEPKELTLANCIAYMRSVQPSFSQSQTLAALYELQTARLDLERLRSELEACRRDAEEKYQWHSIDSAPKDGSEILLYQPKSLMPIRKGFWREEAQRFEFTGQSGFRCEPTHWQHIHHIEPPPDAIDRAMKGE